MPESNWQARPASSKPRSFRGSAVRWGGFAVLTACAGFVSYRLIQLDPRQLVDQASWRLGAAMVAAPVLFAASDKLLASAWSVLAGADGLVASRRTDAIYGRGVLAKYLPGSVFQYASRQIEGASAGLPHGALAKASVLEIALHVPASLTAAGIALALAQVPVLAVLASLGASFVAAKTRNKVLRAGALQFGAFTCFAIAAATIGTALLPGSAALGVFSALFLLSWLAGFLVPVAPGGLGVREAALLALAGSQFPAEPLLACVLALRVASILGDALFGAITLWRASRT
ncbi:hypothetical protein GGQ88_002533 [Novosphingobium hassiacum]|uniref:Uncharacterized protein n=1 Tax=Novosphingobium hassiacum TaxID=173676 RepID=A0A7W5ZWL5_9SPHN|nr:hypothetical protein [Novosphingobium hassiacum]MBB3861261.1 hypothetical protein [Novosphingobium hassiacum]